MIKTFLSDFEKIFVLPKLQENSLLAIPNQYEEFVAELIGLKLKRGVCILPFDDDLEPQFRTLSVDDTWDISIYISLGYVNVERVWSSGEISVLGETILIWPYSSKDILRITLLGNTVESIDVLNPEDRRRIKSAYSVRIFNSEQDVVVANESAKDLLVLKSTPNLFQRDDSIDIGINNLPNLSIYKDSKSSINILNDYRKRGYEIWYL